jgi:hypothetical protein
MKSWLEDLLEQASKSSFVYLIEMKKNSNDWFFQDINEFKDELRQIIWTPRQNSASLFLSEEKVEEFKKEYMAQRKVSIIRLPKNTLNIFAIGG